MHNLRQHVQQLHPHCETVNQTQRRGRHRVEQRDAPSTMSGAHHQSSRQEVA